MANQIASLNIDSLRACSIAELNEVAREHFGIELHGNKPQRLKTLEELIRRAQNEAVAETVTEQDVTLQAIREDILGGTLPKTRLVVNINTGMVFRNTPTLANDPDIRPYNKIPVLVGGRAVMDPDYARTMLPDEEHTHAPREFKE